MLAAGRGSRAPLSVQQSWAELRPPRGAVCRARANLTCQVHVRDQQETGCQEGDNGFGFTCILFEGTHMISVRETEIWKTQDQG